MRKLPIPQAALNDENSIQMLSAWVADKGLHCSLNIGMFKSQGHNESRAWGILISDLIRHIAKATEESHGTGHESVIDEILQSVIKELESPTSKTKGSFVTREH